MYLYDVRVFTEKLSDGVLPINTTLDLSATNDISDLNLVFQNNACPFGLTIDFGNQSRPNSIDLFLHELTGLKHPPLALTLCFWENSLNLANISTLIHGLKSKCFNSGFTLYLSGQNLEQQGMFEAFVDAIALPGSPIGLSVCFDNTSLSSKNINYLLQALKQNRYPDGFFVSLGDNGTVEQQDELFAICAEAAKKGIDYLLQQKNRLPLPNQTGLIDLDVELTLDILTQLQNRFEKNRQFILQKPGRITELGEFKRAIKSNMLVAGSLLDLSQTLSDEHASYCTQLILNLAQILRERFPFELTIDFGTVALNDSATESLFQVFSEVDALLGLSLYFTGPQSLGLNSIQRIIDGFNSVVFEPGFTLRISGRNLEQLALFESFVDTMTSSTRVAWITIDFCHMSQDSVNYLVQELEEHHPLIWINLDADTTPEQQNQIYLNNQRATKTCESFLQLNRPGTGRNPLSIERYNLLKQKINAQCHESRLTSFDVATLRQFMIKMKLDSFSGPASLDLSSIDWTKSRLDLVSLFNYRCDPLELTIEFGQQQIPNLGVESLLQSLYFSGVELNLLGNNLLSFEGLNYLTSRLLNGSLRPGLTLTMSRDNLKTIDVAYRNEQKKLEFSHDIPDANKIFKQFVDAISSSNCTPWLTINLEWDKVSEADVFYLIQALEKQNYAMGLFIQIGTNGTLEQRCKLISLCECAVKQGELFLQANSPNEQLNLTQKEREFLIKRSQDILQQINVEKCILARAKINDHITLLEIEKTFFNNKARRIPSLRLLCEYLSNGILNNQKIGDIFCEWEQQSSLKGFMPIKPPLTTWTTRKLPFFTRTTSSEALLNELQSLNTLDPAQTITKSLSISMTSDA